MTVATNNATDVYFTLHGNVSVTRSSPYVDYTNNVAYVGDDSGNLHLFKGVFGGTLSEVTTGGWPFAVLSSGSRILTGPVYDSTSSHLFVGASNGNLYCVSIAITGSGSSAMFAPTRCSPASISVADGSTASGAILDAPIVDSTAERVFSEAQATNGRGTTESILMQSDINLTNVVRANMGFGGTDLRNGDFDNLYYNAGPGTYENGHLYFCGNATGTARPTLQRIGFNSAGEMNSARGGNSLRLTNGDSTGTAVDCTPLTEVFNGTTDYMFVGVRGHGAPIGCETGRTHEACVMGFNVTSSFPTAAASAISLGGQGSGSSAIVIDNISIQAGASQVYFSNLQNGNATQASQSTLK